MSLYNMLFQKNPLSPYIFGILGIDQTTVEKWPIGRIRDTYVSESGDKLFIFTRNGYTEFDHITDNFKTNHSYFVRAWDDDFDNSYRTYEFNTPVEYLELAKQIADITDTTPPMARYKKLLDNMEKGENNEQVEHAKKVGEQIFGGIINSLNTGENTTITQDGNSVDVFQINPENLGLNNEKPDVQ